MASSDFCCGAECGINYSGSTPSPDGRHLLLIGNTPTVQGTIARNGGQAFRFAATGGAGNSLRHTLAAGNSQRWARFYVYFVTLPDITTTIMRFETAAGAIPSLVYRTGTTDIIPSLSGGTGGTATVVVTGQWYLIDIKADVSGTTATVSLQVNGIDKGTNSLVQAATTFTNIKFGPSCTGALATADMAYDDLITGPGITDYPLGPGNIVGLSPVSDGNHSFATAGLFIYNAAGGNIDPAATDTYQYIDNLPLTSTIGTFLNAATAATEDYLEWGLGSLPAVSVIHGLEFVSTHHAFDANANKQSMQIDDGGFGASVFADIDFSNTTISHYSKHFNVAPSDSAAWTKTGVEALKVRWGSSWTAADVNPDAYIDGLRVEVAYLPTTDSTGSGSPVKTLSKTATGTATQKFTGAGTPTKTLSKTATGTAAARFNASGSPVKTLVMVSAGTSTQKFNASGNPRMTLSMVAVGAANSTGNITGSGNPRKTLSMFAAGVGTSTVYYPLAHQRAFGGRRFEIRYHDTPEPKKKRRRPRPMPDVVIEAQEAPVTPLEPLQAITRRQVNPETWQKIQTAVQVQEILAKAQATHEPIGDVDLRLLRHFLEMVGKGPELTDDEANMPFMLKRFLRMGK